MVGDDEVSFESGRLQLVEKLRRVNEQLQREMLARGFDPAQAEHLALTGPLAKLYMEREELREKLDMMSDGESRTRERT